MELISNTTGIRVPSPVEETMLVNLFASQSLSWIPLIDLRNTLKIYGVSFANSTDKINTEMPVLALLALCEIRRRLHRFL